MAEAEQGASREIAERVRANVLPCLIGAGLLLYFGFERLSEPTGNGLFERANWWFFHAVRTGGVCMAMVTAWSLTGHPTALLADAAVACPLGAVFVLTGPAMLIGGGDTLNGALVTLFGGMFISDGLRNGRTFLQCRTSRVDPMLGMGSDVRASAALNRSEVDGISTRARPLPEAVPLSRTPKRSGETPGVDKPPVAHVGTPLVGKPPVAPDRNADAPATVNEAVPPGGFLAAFAKQPGAEDGRDAGSATPGS